MVHGVGARRRLHSTHERRLSNRMIVMTGQSERSVVVHERFGAMKDLLLKFLLLLSSVEIKVESNKRQGIVVSYFSPLHLLVQDITNHVFVAGMMYLQLRHLLRCRESFIPRGLFFFLDYGLCKGFDHFLIPSDGVRLFSPPRLHAWTDSSYPLSSLPRWTLNPRI